MTLILCIETSTDICSLALIDESGIVQYKSLSEKNVHSSKLASMAVELLTISGKSFSDLNAIAVSKGPGSFTGLRIGVAFAKGLCFGLNIPLIGIDTLYSIAEAVQKESAGKAAYFLPLIDTKTGEAYYCLYDKHLNIIEGPDAGKIDSAIFGRIPKSASVIFAGDDPGKWITQMELNDVNVGISMIHADAKNLLSPAFKKFKSKDFEDLVWFEPFYLRDFKANKFSRKIKQILSN
jgi:tRNA threonylcarbamoyladenosine biosynthesis protein TsaB